MLSRIMLKITLFSCFRLNITKKIGMLVSADTSACLKASLQRPATGLPDATLKRAKPCIVQSVSASGQAQKQPLAEAKVIARIGRRRFINILQKDNFSPSYLTSIHPPSFKRSPYRLRKTVYSVPYPTRQKETTIILPSANYPPEQSSD